MSLCKRAGSKVHPPANRSSGPRGPCWCDAIEEREKGQYWYNNILRIFSPVFYWHLCFYMLIFVEIQAKPRKRSKSMDSNALNENAEIKDSAEYPRLESLKRHFRRFDFNRRQSEICSMDRLLTEVVSFITAEKIFHIPVSS